MTIDKKLNGTSMEIAIEGRLDTMTSPQLEEELKTSLEGITDLTFDFDKLEYISSAGLRVLLSAQKTMNKQGSMKIVHVSGILREVFEVTGLTEMLDIE